jgi:hypothetical protein
MPRIYRWEKCYREALKEIDLAKVPARLLIAERTIRNRMLELNRAPTRQAVNELASLKMAIDRLAEVQSGAFGNIDAKGKAAGA